MALFEPNYPRDLRGYAGNPPHAQWPQQARIAVQFVLNYEEGAENHVLHGDEEEATDFILAALIEYRQWATDSDDEAAALAWIESPQFQADYVAASQALANAPD